MNQRLEPVFWSLRIGLGAAAFLAGCDKFVGLLADWPAYLSPVIAAAIPVSASTFMHVVGVVEIAVGLAVLSGATRAGGYILMAWLVGIAVSLVTSGAFLDVAVRDVEMAIAAFALARLSEVRAQAAGAARERTPARHAAAAA